MQAVPLASNMDMSQGFIRGCKLKSREAAWNLHFLTFAWFPCFSCLFKGVLQGWQLLLYSCYCFRAIKSVFSLPYLSLSSWHKIQAFDVSQMILFGDTHKRLRIRICLSRSAIWCNGDFSVSEPVSIYLTCWGTNLQAEQWAGLLRKIAPIIDNKYL